MWDLFDALEMARDIASKYSHDSTLVISIHLLKGDHYAIRDRADSATYYKKIK